MKKDKFSLETVGKFSANVAARNGWVLNPDKEFRTSIEEGLLESYRRHGYLLCPCREGWGNREQDQDIVCPCKYCADDIDEYGHCYCALFLSEEYSRSGEEPGSIPERRPEELRPE